jgi:hypothetical protein
VIDWRGQRQTFFQRAHQLPKLPPVLVLWGDKDDLIPIAQGLEFARRVEGTVFERFEGCGHYLHNEKASHFAAVVGEFLGARTAPRPRLAMPRPQRRPEPELALMDRLRAFTEADRPSFAG